MDEGSGCRLRSLLNFRLVFAEEGVCTGGCFYQLKMTFTRPAYVNTDPHFVMCKRGKAE